MRYKRVQELYQGVQGNIKYSYCRVREQRAI